MQNTVASQNHNAKRAQAAVTVVLIQILSFSTTILILMRSIDSFWAVSIIFGNATGARECAAVDDRRRVPLIQVSSRLYRYWYRLNLVHGLSKQE